MHIPYLFYNFIVELSIRNVRKNKKRRYLSKKTRAFRLICSSIVIIIEQIRYTSVNNINAVKKRLFCEIKIISTIFKPTIVFFKKYTFVISS